MSEREGKSAARRRVWRMLRAVGVVAGQVLLFLVTLVLVLYFSPSVRGIQQPLLAMALEGRPVHLVFEGGTASPWHGRMGVARPALLDEDEREILRAELLEIDGAGWRGGAPNVGSVLLKKPEVNVFLCPDGTISLLQLLKEKKRKKRKKEKGSWGVESLHIEEGRITIDLPMVTGHIGPFDLTGSVRENKGVSRGNAKLRVERISMELRGPPAVVALITALGWTPELLQTIGPVELSASWDGNRFDVEKLSLAARPFDLRLTAAADLDTLTVRAKGEGTWAGKDFLSLDLALSPEDVAVALRLDPPDFAALPTVEGVALREVRATPTTLRAKGREIVLRIGDVDLGAVNMEHGDLGDLSLAGSISLRLTRGDLAAAWAALLDERSAKELIVELGPTIDLVLEVGLGTVATGDLSLAPKLRLHLDAGFTPPMTLDLRLARLDSALGQVNLRGRLGPEPPLGLPGYEGVLDLKGIDLAALKSYLEVPSAAERFLSGRLVGEVAFEGSPMDPEHLTLSRCAFGIEGGAVSLGIYCPDGGTVIDPTRAPEVGPMTLFKKVIPWGEGKLLLGTPKEVKSPSTKPLRREEPDPLRQQGASAGIAGIVASAYVEDDFGAMNDAAGDGAGFVAEESLWMETKKVL